MDPQTDPSSHSSKKKKRRTSKVDASIEMLKEQQQKNPPVLGYYPSGFDPLKRKRSEPHNLMYYRNQKVGKRIEFVVKPGGSEVDYVGSSYSGEATVGRMNSYVLGVLNKRTQSFKFAPITANRIFRLQPLARAAVISDKEPETPAVIDDAEERKLKRRVLNDRYGTKGAIKKDKEAMRLSQKEDPDAMPEINKIIEETPIDKSAIASSSSLDTSHNVPPHDISATTPEKAYLLDKIILKGEWDYVTDILELLQAGQEIKPDVYPNFVCNRCYKVELCKDEAEKKRIAGILSYITQLINFKNRHSLDGGKSSKQQKFLPSILLQKFTKMFVDSDKNRVADDKIGSLISYILVLTLFVDEFQTDFTDIAKDLKMSALSLRPYFENLGCKIARRNKVTVFTLPVPLTFPTLRKRRRG